MKYTYMILLIVLISACSVQPTPIPTPPPASSPAVGMPNPASAYCQQQGGKTEIRKDAQGGEVGYCVFPDKSECEEWAFQRGECKPGAKPTTPPLVVSTPAPRRISFPPGGTTATVQGTVTTMLGMDNYVLRVLAGQTLSVSLNTKPEQAILTIVGADGQPLITDHADATQWSNPVPATQDYVITVLSRANAPTNYTLQITVPPLVAPTPVAKRITFAAGGTSTTVSGNLGAAALERYVISAQADQVMTVNATSPQQLAILVIYGADGTVLISDHADATSWSGRLPKTQDYIIDVLSRSNTPLAYSVQVTIPPR